MGIIIVVVIDFRRALADSREIDHLQVLDGLQQGHLHSCIHRTLLSALLKSFLNEIFTCSYVESASRGLEGWLVVFWGPCRAFLARVSRADEQ